MLGAGKRGGDRIRVEPGSASSLQSLLAEVVARSRSTPSRKAIRDEEARSLESALGRLPESYRTVVRGYDLEGRSIEEMAGVLKRSPGAVYLLRNRALKRLAELLDPGGES
jgi:RNA polymerase sigma factor (sigma-70 family)